MEALPTRRLAIEASAGTGKTYTLSGLAVRFIAERGVPISEFLIVTFTRAATSELRSRIRQRLVDTADILSSVTAGADSTDHPEIDEVSAHLLQDPQSLDLHLRRIRRAIADFDSATITTIHGFATQVLSTLGTMADTDPDTILVDDTADLLAETCADMLADHSASGTDPRLLPSSTQLSKATGMILQIPGLKVVPDPQPPADTDSPETDPVDPRARAISDLAMEAASRLARRRESAGTMSFDDVLVRLREAVEGEGADTVVRALQSRFRVALIDEFQDTDPVQWAIFRQIFGDGGGSASSEPSSDTALVLVGDPKQAIYSFRGADIETYLDAVGSHHDPGARRQSLDTNWRSDGALLKALEALFRGATFGNDEIAFSSVAAAPHHEETRIRDRDGQPEPALAIRLALGPDLERGTSKAALIKVPAARSAIFHDLVDQVGNLIRNSTIPDPAAPPQHQHQQRAIKPSDIAVLTLNRTHAEEIRSLLDANGIPAVVTRGTSVLRSRAASEWRSLLQAIARPSDPRAARTYAAGWFGGHDLQWVIDADDQQIADLQDTIHTWAETLSRQGLAPMLRQVRLETGITARVISGPDGDRSITDLDHVAELLHDAHRAGAIGAEALLESLDTEPATTTDTEADGDLTARRVESEAEAVQIMTVWVAKGLEFPVVCLPTLWNARGQRDVKVVYHSPDLPGRPRTFDAASVLGGPSASPPKAWPDKASTTIRRELAAGETVAEDLRLLYVALTRAKHHMIVWWSSGQLSEKTALARILFGRTPDGELDPSVFDPGSLGRSKVALPADDAAESFLASLVEASHGTISTALHGRHQPSLPVVRRSSDTDLSAVSVPLSIGQLERSLDRSAHRWSFTAIVNAGRRLKTDHGGPGFTPTIDPLDPTIADAGASDEGADSPAPATSTEPLGAGDSSPGSPLLDLPAGAEFGSLVHAALEIIDFTATDLHDEVAEAVTRVCRFSSVDLRPLHAPTAKFTDGVQLLIEGLESAINTPLGPLFEDGRLRDLPRRSRLDEMGFELQLASSGPPPSGHQVGELVLHHLPADDLLRGWADDLATDGFGIDLAGHLTGSIDAILRVPGSDRFIVVDYKSNRLHPADDPAARGHYSQQSMAEAMAHHHYPLQALLYSVALHRYLRWRLPSYRPAVNLGGIAYMFVRGMSGPEVPRRHEIPDGVFTWRVPPALVTDLSDLLDGRSIRSDAS